MANPTSTLTFSHSGTGGVAAVSVPSLVVGATAVPSTISTSGNHLTFTGSSGWFFSTTTTGGQLQVSAGSGFPINFNADNSLNWYRCWLD